MVVLLQEKMFDDRLAHNLYINTFKDSLSIYKFRNHKDVL